MTWRAGMVVLAVMLAGPAMADDLSPANAEALLLPAQDNSECGDYYTTQGEPDFADIDSKAMCVYHPRVTRIVPLGANRAGAEYNRDRAFDDKMSLAWLKDYDRMLTHETPSPLFKLLKQHLDGWRATAAGVDHGPRPAQATFKLDATGWHVEQAP